MFGIAAFSAAPFSALEPLNPNVATALLGVSASGNVNGLLSALTGVSTSGRVGNLGVGNRSGILDNGLKGNLGNIAKGISITLTGVTSRGTLNSLGVNPRSIGLQGTQAIGNVGNIVSVYWRIIDDSQTPPDPNWIPVDTPAIDPLWVLINTPT